MATDLTEIVSLRAQLAALDFTIEVTGPDSIGQFTADCLEVPGALGYGATPGEATLSSMRAILPIIKAREERKDRQLSWAQEAISSLIKRAQLAEARVNVASLADYVNIWAREWGIKETDAKPLNIKKTLDMLWGEASVSRNVLAEARADADALAVALKVIARRVNGNEELRGCEEFYKGYNSANDACRNLANQALASRPEAAKKRAEAVRDAHRMCLEASLGDMDAKLAVSDVETLLREAWGM